MTSTILKRLIERPIQNEQARALDEWRKRMRADRAWLELAADQFQPHSPVSMNTWIRSQQDLANSSLFFEFTYQRVNDSLDHRL
jgi:hypothetical protein